MTEIREICFLKPANAWGRGGSMLLPVVLLVAGVVLLRSILEPWLFMWVFAFAIFFGCKWITLIDAADRNHRPPLACVLRYLLTWPGMNARPFLRGTAVKTTDDHLLPPLLNLFAGLLLVTAAPLIEPRSPLLTGWLGMGGIVLVLHFGLFELLAITWRRAGVNVASLMRAPMTSVSLAEFWGERWNTAFHDLAHRYIFRPSVLPAGVAGATLCTFLASGIIHDAVISFPANGGFGLPTLYFLIQGAGVLCERSAVGRGMGLGRGLRGRLFTWAVLGLPLGLLFHAAFIEKIILPMLHALTLH